MACTNAANATKIVSTPQPCSLFCLPPPRGGLRKPRLSCPPKQQRRTSRSPPTSTCCRNTDLLRDSHCIEGIARNEGMPEKRWNWSREYRRREEYSCSNISDAGRMCNAPGRHGASSGQKSISRMGTTLTYRASIICYPVGDDDGGNGHASGCPRVSQSCRDKCCDVPSYQQETQTEPLKRQCFL